MKEYTNMTDMTGLEFLGDAAADLAAQRGTVGLDAMRRTLAQIETRYTNKRGEQDASAQANAANGAAMVALGDETLETLGDEWRRLHAQAAAALENLVGAMIWEDSQGATVSDITARAGVTRRTVYKALAPME